ncbi:molybdopterin molybdotransferase MoeA [Nakamurella endophytica]|uniref:Molybdopterin molybdenumtransferase n=1 Tax=Nakamurella endophytica TaxID=1748367 RepID=A0A917TC63_9ACTN|nr:gephyrin-like molybdotransferase Glp [Nakamurella endophytica]GGM18256.1 molybdopterin molybdenumtransferase [Nakamurella endophytica]
MTGPSGLRSVEEHAAAVAALLAPAPAVRLPLARCLDRVLAEDLVAAIDLPPFANSAMDGYAVRAADLAALPATLPVSQDIPAGRTDTAPLRAGTAARIMTGAPVPDGADTVVPVERTDAGVDRVRIDAAPAPGVHVRRVGEDVTAGTVVLRAGTVVRAAQIGVAAALGNAELAVRRPLRVLLLSTGTELVEPGRPLGPGQIYESNAAMLAAAVTEAGGVATVAHFVTDDVDRFRAALDRALDLPHGDGPAGDDGPVDLVVTSGGVSAGAYEVVKDALTGAGVEFAKVAMQPGMPQGAGTLAAPGGRRVPVVTLPGNPVSSYVSFEVFLRPAVRAALGHPDVTRPVVRVPLSTGLDSPPGKRQFRRGQLDAVTGTVAPWGGPGSHLLGWLAGADAMIVVPPAVTRLEAGDDVEVWLLG